MNTQIDRRQFLRSAAAFTVAAGAACSGPALFAAGQPSRKLRAGVMGLGRGLDHVRALLRLPDVEVAWLCEVDAQRLAAAAKLTQAQAPPPKTTTDFRRILEDPAVDALFIAAPNFWHAPATILACAAGKHVYVEKPGSHNAEEALLMAQAAHQHERKVQVGTQRRSWPGVMEGMQRLREGVIGRVAFCRTFYTNARGSIGRGKPVPVPDYLSYTLWQGPVPERPYLDNLVHYNWHWRWHWGGGELANNGVHALDLARWGLQADYPRRITCTGARYCYEDDQETPDTAMAAFDFGVCGASFDQSSCHLRKQEALPFVIFYGEKGSLAQEGPGYRIFDPNGVQVGSGTGPGNDDVHIANFLSAIREGTPLNADIADAHKSALLCHLGNIAYRTQREVHFDVAKRRLVRKADAQGLWSREYRAGWWPRV